MVFLTLFLDLIGFSIIFPLFPSMAIYYYHLDPNNTFIQLFNGLLHLWPTAGDLGHASFQTYVIFGGLLSALYSLIQFFTSPYWGQISDRIGRRPVLLISSLGMALSYLLWFLAGNFSLLIIGRIFGGIFSGNVSTATAAVADLTSKEKRGKGMAIIGIAFALGFILGPALGGILSLIDLTQYYPSLIQYGINPFSVPALLAFLLAMSNFFLILFRYKETLQDKKRTTGPMLSPFRLLNLIGKKTYPGVLQVSWSNFIFTFVFSGLEFTLIFLVAERFGFTPRDNAGMFVYVGLVLTIIQGYIVRKWAHQVGYRLMALAGHLTLIIGFLFMAHASELKEFYLGLTLMAIGSGITIPSLTSMASLYVPSNEQGYYLGLFRSLSSLARALGPLLQAIVYWRMGSSFPYLISPFVLIISVILILLLPNVSTQQDKMENFAEVS